MAKNQQFLFGGVDDTDLHFLEQAYRYGMEHSDDPNTRLGAVLVQGDEIIGYGTNRFPKGVVVEPSRLQRPTKYHFIDHAERQAVWDALDKGNDPKGAVLYCPWFSCEECAKVLVGTGIAEVVGHKPALDAYADQPGRHDWEQCISYGLQILREGGVNTRVVDQVIGGGLEAKLHGKIISP